MLDKIMGQKVYLTPITYDDCEHFVAMRNSDLVKSRYIYRKDFTVEGQINWIKTKVETGEVAQFMIWDVADDKQIGSVLLQDIDTDNRTCELGIFIAYEDYLGGGRGREAAELIIKYGFEQLHMHKIYLRVLADNERAIRSYEHAGFVKERLAHDEVFIDGEPVDVIFMAIHNNQELFF